MDDEEGGRAAEGAAPRRRGRPALLPPEVMEELRGRAPHLTTRRSLMNHVYFSRAYTVLHKADPQHERYGWLLGQPGREGVSSRCGGPRVRILTELGRLPTDARVFETADALCQDQRPTPNAILFVRLMRGVVRPPRSYGLEHELARTVDNYRQRYPKTSGEQILDEVLDCANVCRRLFLGSAEQPEGLEHELLAYVTSYRRRHPDVSWDAINHSLFQAQYAILKRYLLPESADEPASSTPD